MNIRGEGYVCLNDCYMYVSPGKRNALAISAPIPAGTILECENYYMGWEYTSYNGVNGWVANKELAYKRINNFITTTNASIYAQPKEDFKTAKIIPQNFELRSTWSTVYGVEIGLDKVWHLEGYIMVTYCDENVWIRIGDVASKRNNDIYNETIKFTENLVIDDKLLISKGETVQLHSNYAVTVKYKDYSYTDHYFVYNDSGFWESDLGIFYPQNYYVVFLKNHKDLPINQKIKIKYYRNFQGVSETFFEEGLTGRFYFEYNNKNYEIKSYNIDGMCIVNDDLCSIYRATNNFSLTKSIYSNEVVAKVSVGDTIYSLESTPYLNGYKFLVTEGGIYGFADAHYISATASEVPKEELLDSRESKEDFYIEVSKGDATKLINFEDPREEAREEEIIFIPPKPPEEYHSAFNIACFLSICSVLVIALIVVIVIKLVNKSSGKATKIEDKDKTEQDDITNI